MLVTSFHWTIVIFSVKKPSSLLPEVKSTCNYEQKQKHYETVNRFFRRVIFFLFYLVYNFSVTNTNKTVSLSPKKIVYPIV